MGELAHLINEENINENDILRNSNACTQGLGKIFSKRKKLDKGLMLRRVAVHHLHKFWGKLKNLTIQIFIINTWYQCWCFTVI